METKLPSIVITGASGFIGKYFLDAIKESYRIIGIARRSQKEADIPEHSNITWIQCDIGNRLSVIEATHIIIEKGGADFLLHLAAYYDFECKWLDEYQHTNIDGTKNILEMARMLNIKRFIFISSIAACKFPKSGSAINEKTPPEGPEPYSVTKKIGEQMIKEYTKYFPCFIVRLTAVFSDWCEYAPLYKFLNVWLSNKWDSKILGGKGQSAIPYIYIQDVIRFLAILLNKHKSLPQFDTFNVSPDGSTSHFELFKSATRDYFGEELKPIFLPKILAFVGILFRTFLRKLKLKYNNSFERLWMIKYIDLKLTNDSSYTRKVLGWKPLPRYHIKRRMLYLIEKMRNHPVEWQLKNETAFKRVTTRPGWLIYQAMLEDEEKLLEWIIIKIRFSESGKFIHYKKMNFSDFKSYMSSLYHLLLSAVRSGDRSLMLKSIDLIASKRFSEGFEPEEICGALNVFNDVIISNLSSRENLRKIKSEIQNYVGMAIQIAIDEVEEIYDSFDKNLMLNKLHHSNLMPDLKTFQNLISQINTIYQKNPEENKIVRDQKKDNKISNL
jgi:dTDP-glucose 4,6-dehydratase